MRIPSQKYERSQRPNYRQLVDARLKRTALAMDPNNKHGGLGGLDPEPRNKTMAGGSAVNGGVSSGDWGGDSGGESSMDPNPNPNPNWIQVARVRWIAVLLRKRAQRRVNSDRQQPDLMNPKLLNPKLLNPTLLNPKLLNPKLMNPKLLNPKLLNPKLLNPNPRLSRLHRALRYLT